MDTVTQCNGIAVYEDAAANTVTVLAATTAGLYVSTDAGNSFDSDTATPSVIDPVLAGEGQTGFGGVAVHRAGRIAYAVRDGDFDTDGPAATGSDSPTMFFCDVRTDPARLAVAANWGRVHALLQPLNRRAWMLHVDQSSGRLYLATRGTGTLTHASMMTGDLNGDGFVGIADLNLVLGNWNKNVTACDLLSGDPSGDGFIGILDLNAVLGNWNQGTPPPFE